MKFKQTLKFSLLFGSIFLLLFFYNNKLELIAFHPFRNNNAKFDIKVLTWNVHCPEGTYYERQKLLANKILEIDADIVSLNEIFSDSCMVLDSILKSKYVFQDLSTSHTICGNAFYSKLPLYNSGMIDTQEYMKPVSMIAATICVEDDSIFIVNLHLHSNSGDGSEVLSRVSSLKHIGQFYERYKVCQERRNWSISFIKKWVVEQSHPAIVMGDFNDFSFSAPLDSLKGIGMVDSWWEGGSGYGCTFHEGWMRLRIDYIFHSHKLKLCGINVIDTEISDHNPVVAKFEYKKLK